MFVIIYNNFLEILLVSSSFMLLLTMIYFVSNLSNVIEQKISNIAKNNKDLEREKFELLNKVNKYKDHYETNQAFINKLLKEKEEILDKLAKLELYNDYVTNLEKENKSLFLKLQNYEKKFEKEKDLRLKEDRRRKNILIQESFPIMSYHDEYK